MKTTITILFFTFIAFTIYSCSDDYVNNSPGTPSVDNFIYPVNLNTFWYYTTRNFVTNLRGDSVHNYFDTDTTIGFGGSKFLKDTIINNDTLWVLSNNHTDTLHSHTTLELYKQTDSGMIRTGYWSDGINFGPYRQSSNLLKYSVNGKHFNSLNEILRYYNSNESYDDTTLYLDSIPLRVLKYPITQNSEWEFVTYPGNTRITKKYTTFETVNLSFGSFYCIKIQRNWYYNTPTPDPRFISYDYFSKEGMIKRDFTIKDVLFQNSNQDTLGIFDVKDQAELLNIINEH